MPPSKKLHEMTPKPLMVTLPKPKQDKPIQPPPTLPKEQGRGELEPDSTPLLTSPQKPYPKSEKMKPIMPIKPKIPLSYEAKGKGKVDDLQPPKEIATQDCQARAATNTFNKGNAKIANAVIVETSQKTKVFQPKYPSMTNRKRKTKQIFVPKDQLDGYFG